VETQTRVTVTRFELASLVLAGIQLLLALGGFWLVYRTLRVLIEQTMLLRNSVDSGANASVGERQLGADLVFVEHPNLRKYFLEGVDLVPADPDYPAGVSAAQLLANFFDTYFLQRRSLPQLYEDATWQAYIKAHIVGGPILRRFIRENRSWFSRDLVDFVEDESRKHRTEEEAGDRRPKTELEPTARARS
jgi:hypothetical protein